MPASLHGSLEKTKSQEARKISQAAQMTCPNLFPNKKKQAVDHLTKVIDKNSFQKNRSLQAKKSSLQKTKKTTSLKTAFSCIFHQKQKNFHHFDARTRPIRSLRKPGVLLELEDGRCIFFWEMRLQSARNLQK